MTSLKISVFIWICCILATSSLADIYEWTDENGVKHFSNYAPAENSKVLMKTKEVPYDEAADQARMEFERQERLELARLELAQREAELELREAEAKRKLAEAERMAQELQHDAGDYYDDAITSTRIIYRGGGLWCRDHRYGCSYPIHHRWSYRQKPFRSSDHKFYYANPHRPHRYATKKHSGFNKGHDDYKYRNKLRYHHLGNDAKYKSKSRAATSFRGNRIGSFSAGLQGRGSIGWKSAGFSRRH